MIDVKFVRCEFSPAANQLIFHFPVISAVFVTLFRGLRQKRGEKIDVVF